MPRSAFPNVLQPYKSQEIAPPNLGNSPRIDSLMRDGKIYLSIDDAVAFALENNLDLDIARYNLNIAEADLLRAKSGASILGVNTGIVQNTPAVALADSAERLDRARAARRSRPAARAAAPMAWSARLSVSDHRITSFDPAAHQHLATRQEQHRVRQRPFSPVPIVCAEHLHCGFRLHPGLSIGRLA